MGWDVAFVRLKRDVARGFPFSASELSDEDYLHDVASSALKRMVSTIPNVKPCGSNAFSWMKDLKRGFMNLSFAGGILFVNQAKVPGLLELHARLEAFKPGWCMLDVRSFVLYDRESFLRTFETPGL